MIIKRLFALLTVLVLFPILIQAQIPVYPNNGGGGGTSTGPATPTGTGLIHVVNGAQDTTAYSLQQTDIPSLQEAHIIGLVNDLTNFTNAIGLLAPLTDPNFIGIVTASSFELGNGSGITRENNELVLQSNGVSVMSFDAQSQASIAGQGGYCWGIQGADSLPTTCMWEDDANDIHLGGPNRDDTTLINLKAGNFEGALNGVNIIGSPAMGNVPVITALGEATWKNNVPAGTGLYHITDNVLDSTSYTLQSSDIPAELDSSITGNSASATKSDHTMEGCPTGQYPTGIDSSWNFTGCTVPPGGDLPNGPGTVTTVSATGLDGLFDAHVANDATTPVISYTAISVPAHTFYGNNTDVAAPMSGVQITDSDLPEDLAGTQAHNTVYASPDGINGTPKFLALTPAYIPVLPESQITDLASDLQSLAPKANPVFSGLASLPTVSTSGSLLVNGNAGLPDAAGGGLFLTSGFASPVIGKVYLGDGTGWHLNFSKRTASTDTDLFAFNDNGSMSALGTVFTSGNFSTPSGGYCFGASNITANPVICLWSDDATDVHFGNGTKATASNIAITAKTFIGALQGNASTATMATNANFATAATTATSLTGSISESQVTGLATDLSARGLLAGNNNWTGSNTFNTTTNMSLTSATGGNSLVMLDVNLNSTSPISMVLGRSLSNGDSWVSEVFGDPSNTTYQLGLTGSPSLFTFNPSGTLTANGSVQALHGNHLGGGWQPGGHTFTLTDVANTGNIVGAGAYTVIADGQGLTIPGTLNLPSASSFGNDYLNIIRTDSNTSVNISVTAGSGVSINGASSYILNQQHQSVELESDGVNWHIVSQNNPATTTASQPANSVYASPNGVAGILSPRKLVAADVPFAAALASSPVFTGTVSAPAYTLNSIAGNWKPISFNTNGSQRWQIGSDNSSESGSNAGSNFGIFAYSDNGSVLSNPINILRSTGVTSFSARPVFAGATPWDSANFNPALNTGDETLNGNVTMIPATAATSGANVSSKIFSIGGNFWNGTASAPDGYELFANYDSGTNPSSDLVLTKIIGGLPLSTADFDIKMAVTIENALHMTSSNSIDWLSNEFLRESALGTLCVGRSNSTCNGNFTAATITGTAFVGGTIAGTTITGTSYTGGASLTGTPTAPTAATAVATTQIATMAAVHNVVTALPAASMIFGRITIAAGQLIGNDSSHTNISVNSNCSVTPITVSGNPTAYQFTVNVSPSNIAVNIPAILTNAQPYMYMCAP